jgi:hypothetical protein
MSTVRRLMEELQISSVYWIDDVNTAWKELSADDLPDRFAEALADATTDQQKLVIKTLEKGLNGSKIVGRLRKLPKAEDEEEDTFIERVSSSVRSMAAEEDNLIASLYEVGNLIPQPISSTDKTELCSLFNPAAAVPWKWNRWSFLDWSRDGKKQLANHTEKEPWLFIVDLQNKDTTVGVDGRSILSALAASNLPREAMHILVLTSECKQDGEFKLGRELTKTYFDAAAPIQLPVFVMAKARLGGSENGPSAVPASIAEGLSRICVSSQHRRLKGLLENVFTDAVAEAFSSLESLTLEEFMYAVTHRSESEGVPEIDTLLRIIGIEQRRKLLQAVIGNDELQRILTRIRGSGLRIAKSELASDKAIEDLRIAELYDPATVVNMLRSPISPGDLFAVETTNNSQRPSMYCLVGNFCDVSLRRNGSRKAEIGLLLPLEALKHGKGTERLQYPLEKLEAFLPAGVSANGLPLHSFKSIDFAILDLCWTNNEGLCRWSATLSKENKERFGPSQNARLKILDNLFSLATDKSNLLSVQATLGSNVRYMERALLKRIKTRSRRFPQKLKGQPPVPMAFSSVDFGIKRIGRLSHSHASHMVAEFTDALGRASRAHDFSGDGDA